MARKFETFKIDTAKFKSLCIVDIEKVQNGDNAVIAYINLGSDKAEITKQHFMDAELLASSAEMKDALLTLKSLFEGKELIDAGAVRRIINQALKLD